MNKAYHTSGKQVLDPQGQHFADAASDVAALLIVCALEMRKHRPTIEGDQIICSRCRNELPHDGHEPCIPRAPRCTDTPDLFDKGERKDCGDQSAEVPMRRASQL